VFQAVGDHDLVVGETGLLGVTLIGFLFSLRRDCGHRAIVWLVARVH
jgi:hypothetical protein